MKNFSITLVLFLLSVSLFTQNYKGQTVVNDEDVIVLNDEDKEIFRQETLKRIKSFQGHLTFISSKENTSEEKAIYKEIALSNFINKGKNVVMEVSSKSKVTGQEKRRRLPIVTYLDNLCNLSYAKVELSTAKSCYVSNWIKTKKIDENLNPIYKATATYYQIFIGYREGKPVYKDVTKKTIEIEIRWTTDLLGARWIVYLGDISVADTTV